MLVQIRNPWHFASPGSHIASAFLSQGIVGHMVHAAGYGRRAQFLQILLVHNLVFITGLRLSQNIDVL
jgi:hypothetical protein